MPDDLLAGFLETPATAVVPGGTVCVVDKQPDEDSASERTTRRPSDGRLLTVIDHPRPASTWVAAFTAASIDLEAEAIGERFLCMRGRRV